MKSLVYLAMVAMTGVSAVSTAAAPTVDGDKDCEANYIVKQCLQTENDKLAACSVADYQCRCYAAQAIATCYNNCPNDARAPGATQAMNGACMNASAHATTTKAASTAAAAAATTSPTSPTTAAASSSLTSSATGASKTNGADGRAGSAAGMLAAVAGAVAVVL